MRRVIRIILTLLALLVGQYRSALAIDIYASEFVNPSIIYRLNQATAQPMAVTPPRALPMGLDFRSDGVLYAGFNVLTTRSLVDGSVTTLGTLPELMTSIAFAPNGNLYGVNNSGSKLYRLDPATGESLGSVTLTGTVNYLGGSLPNEINGIDFAPDGTLYGIGFGLYTINLTTGVASRITPLGLMVSGELMNDLDFGADGMLRSLTTAQTPSKSKLFEINPATGTGQNIGSTAMSMSGIATIPEPGIYVALFAGSVLVLRSRMRQKS